MLNLFSFLLTAIFFNSSLNILGMIKYKTKLIHYDFPFDFNKKLFDGYRILGKSTTWGGFMLILFLGVLLDLLFDSSINFLLFGMLVFLGHAMGSFIKRRFGFNDGKFMPIVDHGDYIILSGLFFYVSGQLELRTFALGLLIILILQPLTTYTFYKIGLRENPL